MFYLRADLHAGKFFKNVLASLNKQSQALRRAGPTPLEPPLPGVMPGRERPHIILAQGTVRDVRSGGIPKLDMHALHVFQIYGLQRRLGVKFAHALSLLLRY